MIIQHCVGFLLYWCTYLQPEKNVEIDQSSRQHHALLKVDIVISCPMDQEIVLAVEIHGFGTQIRTLVSFPIASRPRKIHIPFGVCGI